MTIGFFGERLKRLRTQAGMTQEELAQKCGIQKQSISRYEKSEREPNIRTAKKIADALGVPLEALAPTAHFNLQFFAEDPVLQKQHEEINELFDRLPPEIRTHYLGILRGLAQASPGPDDPKGSG